MTQVLRALHLEIFAQPGDKCVFSMPYLTLTNYAPGVYILLIVKNKGIEND